MKIPTLLVPAEYAELLRQTKTTAEVVFLCRVLLRKRLASEDNIKVVCRTYGLNYADWQEKNFVATEAVQETKGRGQKK